MDIPINLLITTILLGLIFFLTYLLINKLVNKSQQNNVQNQPQQNNDINNNINNENIPNNPPNQFEEEFIPPENNDPNFDPFKKLTKKEQLKMLKKQEKAEQKERMRLLLEEKKMKEREKEKELLLKEKMREEAEQKLQEEIQKVQEEQKKKDDEIYNQWKDMMKVGEEGEEKMDFKNEEVINKFLDYIKIRKVVSLEDISGTFKLSTNDIVMKLNQFEQEGRIFGIIDDRGKYIYITEKEMGLIEKMFMNRGRISKADLIKECNRLIRFEPTEEDKIKIAEEQKKTLKELEDELNVKK